MKSPKDSKHLDELISRAVSRERPTFDFDKWKQNHKGEIEIYESQRADGQITQSVHRLAYGEQL